MLRWFSSNLMIFHWSIPQHYWQTARLPVLVGDDSKQRCLCSFSNHSFSVDSVFILFCLTAHLKMDWPEGEWKSSSETITERQKKAEPERIPRENERTLVHRLLMSKQLDFASKDFDFCVWFWNDPISHERTLNKGIRLFHPFFANTSPHCPPPINNILAWRKPTL